MRSANKWTRWIALTLALCLCLSAQAEDTLQQITDSGHLRIGLEADYPPFSQADGQGGQKGFEVDVGRALAEQLGVQPVFVTFAWEKLLDALTTGQVDVIMNQINITPERQRRFDFSRPYIFSGVQLVALRPQWSRFAARQDLAGLRIGVNPGTYYEQWLHEHAPRTTIVLLSSALPEQAALQKGLVDAVMVSRLAAFQLQAASGGNLLPVGHVLTSEEAGVVMRLHQPRLKARLDLILGRLRQDGTLTDISARWFKADVTSPAE